jgi:hypothetical protein
MSEKTIEIPLRKATYEELQQVICELQVEKYIKNKEVEELKEQLENDIDRYEDTISYQLGFDKGKEYMQHKIDKAIEYIKNNCVLSDEWRDLGFCNFIPTGKITYKQLTPKKVKELLEILGEKE